MPPFHAKPWMDNTTDYAAIWTARAGQRPPGLNEARAKRYAEAIKRRFSELWDERKKAAKPDDFTGRLKGLAVALAKLDGHDSADIVLETLALPSQWDAFARICGVRALLLSARLALNSMLAVFDPAIEHLLSQGLHERSRLLSSHRLPRIAPLQ